MTNTGTAAKPAKHTCNNGHGPSFGRKTAGCPRCDELLAGAAPVSWGGRRRSTRAEENAREAHRLAHFAAGGPHARGLCGPVCTAFDY